MSQLGAGLQGNNLTFWSSRLFTSWFIAVTSLVVYDGGSFTQKSFAQERGLVIGIITAITWVAITVVVSRWHLRPVQVTGWGLVPAPDHILLFVSALVLAFTGICYYPDFNFALGLLAALAVVGIYLYGYYHPRPEIPVVPSTPRASLQEEAISPRQLGLMLLLGSLMVLFIGGITVLRYLSYSAPNFDFGIFANMFHNMRESGLPLVSSERDRLMSHFQVHLSPIYYLILPIYALFPSPVTLQLAQGIILASGLIPLLFLCRHYKLSPATADFLMVIYAFYPAITTGSMYDLHENCFLTPLILWLCWAYEKKSGRLLALMALLICAVKEDAPIYILFFALYLALNRKDYKNALLLAGGGTLYFAAALFYLTSFGEGVMSYRYSNVIYGSAGLLGVLKTGLLNPLLLLKEAFEPAKVEFAIKMLLPLGCLPLFSRRISSFILLLPMVLVNMIPDYQYQHSLDFQYIYGVAGFLIFLTVTNLADIPAFSPKPVVAVVSIITCLTFVALAGRRVSYVQYYLLTRESQQVISTALAIIPPEAAVTADTFFVAHLAQRREVYEYPSQNSTAYIVLDLRGLIEVDREAKIAAVTELGYRELYYAPRLIVVFINN